MTPPRQHLPYPLAAAVCLLWLSVHGECAAVGRIVLEAEEIRTPRALARNVSAELGLRAGGAPAARLRADRLELPEPAGSLRSVTLDCREVIAEAARYGCRSARIAARGGPLGSLDFRTSLSVARPDGILGFDASDLAVAGSRIRFGGSFGNGRWHAYARGSRLELAELRRLATPWIDLPPDLALDGRLDLRLEASGDVGRSRLALEVRTADLGFTNEDATTVAEQVAASLAATVSLTPRGTALDLRLAGTAGQALAGPALLDFGANPLELEASGTLADGRLEIPKLTVSQKDLLRARGEARVTLGEAPALAHARIELERLEFPAAYTSFLQLPLAATDFGALRTAGSASGTVEVADGALARLDLRLADLDIEDTRGKFSMADVHGELHWADGAARVDPSYLAWSRGSAYGLSGGGTRLDFLVHGRDFRLLETARVPVFDGAVIVQSLAARGLGTADAELDFEATIEPISMPLLSRAFGWPELQGSLAGRIPGLAYRNRELTVDGDLVAQVFDGTIVGSRFRLRDPLGPWPRLFADVRARRLDLELVTRTFSIGTMTGRLDADIEGLELFDWSPVAFDARLYSTPGDRSARLISQKAVTSISSIGGGGGAVTAALQSGVLRFFDVFKYDRVGLTCRLRNDVCLMGGIEPAGIGYYIVKGRGLPRIDIIGNAGRVDWPQLVDRIAAAMRSGGPVVR